VETAPPRHSIITPRSNQKNEEPTPQSFLWEARPRGDTGRKACLTFHKPPEIEPKERRAHTATLLWEARPRGDTGRKACQKLKSIAPSFQSKPCHIQRYEAATVSYGAKRERNSLVQPFHHAEEIRFDARPVHQRRTNDDHHQAGPQQAPSTLFPLPSSIRHKDRPDKRTALAVNARPQACPEGGDFPTFRHLAGC